MSKYGLLQREPVEDDPVSEQGADQTDQQPERSDDNTCSKGTTWLFGKGDVDGDSQLLPGVDNKDYIKLLEDKKKQLVNTRSLIEECINVIDVTIDNAWEHEVPECFKLKPKFCSIGGIVSMFTGVRSSRKFKELFINLKKAEKGL